MSLFIDIHSNCIQVVLPCYCSVPSLRFQFLVVTQLNPPSQGFPVHQVDVYKCLTTLFLLTKINLGLGFQAPLVEHHLKIACKCFKISQSTFPKLRLVPQYIQTVNLYLATWKSRQLRLNVTELLGLVENMTAS